MKWGGGVVFKEVQPLQAMVNCQAKQTEAKDKAKDEHRGHTEGGTEQAKWRQGEVRLVKHTKCHLHGPLPVPFVDCCSCPSHGLSRARGSHY